MKKPSRPDPTRPAYLAGTEFDDPETLAETLVEWTLAICISVAILAVAGGMIVSALLLWSSGMVNVLAAMAIIGAVLSLARLVRPHLRD